MLLFKHTPLLSELRSNSIWCNHLFNIRVSVCVGVWYNKSFYVIFTLTKSLQRKKRIIIYLLAVDRRQIIIRIIFVVQKKRRLKLRAKQTHRQKKTLRQMSFGNDSIVDSYFMGMEFCSFILLNPKILLLRWFQRDLPVKNKKYFAMKS